MDEAELHEQNINNNQPQGYASRKKHVGRHWYAYCKEWARLGFATPRYSQMIGVPENLSGYRNRAFFVTFEVEPATPAQHNNQQH
jgi:hypothetical protein